MIEKNDPRLTDFVLGELDEQTAAQVSAAIESSVELQLAIAEIEQATSLLESAFESEPQLNLTALQRDAIREAADQQTSLASALTQSPTKPQPAPTRSMSFVWQSRWTSIAAVASLLGLLIGGTWYLVELQQSPSETVAVAEPSAEAADRPMTDSRGAEAMKLDSAPPGAQKLKEPLMDSLAKSDADIELAPAEAKGGGGFGGGGGGGFGGAGLGGRAPGADRSSQTMVPMRPDSAVIGQQEKIVDAQPTQAKQPLTQPKSALLDPSVAELAQTKAGAVPAAPGQLEEMEGKFDLADNALGERLLPAPNSPQSVVEQTRKLLDESGLKPLGLSITTRDIPVAQSLQRPLSRYQQRRITQVQANDDGSPRTTTETVKVPVRTMVPQPTTILFVEPVISIDPQQATALVDRLARQVDPEEQQKLSFERLFGLDTKLLLGGETDLEFADNSRPQQAGPEPSLARGRFAKLGKVGSQVERATFSLALALNQQLDAQTLEPLAGDNGVPLSEEAADDVMDLDQPPAAEVADFEQLGGQRQRGGQEAPGKQMGRAPTAGISPAQQRSAGTDKRPTVVYALAPNSIEELDFSELIQQLKSALQKRNQRIAGNRDNPDD